MKRVKLTKGEKVIIAIEVVATILLLAAAIDCLFMIHAGKLWPVSALPLFGFGACLVSEDAERIYRGAAQRKL